MVVQRIFDLLSWQAGKFKKSDALAAKENNHWVRYSTLDFIENVNSLSFGLLFAGIEKQDKIATVSNNRPEWNFVDMAVLQVGGIHVPIYPNISSEEYKYILNDAEVKILFVSDEALYQKMKAIKSEIPSLKEIYTFNRVADAPHWSELKDQGIKNANPHRLAKIKDSIMETDLATLIYTSGTTGMPKGVMLSHKNMVSNFLACRDLTPVDSNCRALSFLPLNHVYERMLTYLYMYLGVSIYYAESKEKIGDNLKEITPEVFSTVPLLLEKVYEKILAKGYEQKGIKKTLFFWALDLAMKFELNGSNGFFYDIQLGLANKIVFSKWREALGGRVRCIVSGGAALQPRLARIFRAAGIPVLEGYGLTETSPVIAVNTLDPEGTMFGTVGKVIEGVQVFIAEDGEILCKGPNIMMGYYKKPESTVEVIDAEGWFHTGDIGEMVDGKYLKITDRKKEMFKTSGGKYIAPQPIENKLKESVLQHLSYNHLPFLKNGPRTITLATKICMNCFPQRK
jgi:long-chain acyl-CoA synthetase